MPDCRPPARRPNLAAVARLAPLFLVVLPLAGCAARGFVRPVGDVVPVPVAEAQAIWQDATAACAAVKTFNAEVRPSGRVGDSRVRGVTLVVAVSDALIGIEAEVAGQTLFLLRGSAERATLLLRRPESRVVVAPPSAILAALVGLETDPTRLLALFSGCITTTRQARRVDRVGDTLRVETPDAVVYLRQGDSGWRPVAGEFGDLVVDYRRVESGRPATIGLRSAPIGKPSVDLSLSVRNAVLNRELPAAAFTVVVPSDAIETPVSDLRVLGGE